MKAVQTVHFLLQKKTALIAHYLSAWLVVVRKNVS